MPAFLIALLIGWTAAVAAATALITARRARCNRWHIRWACEHFVLTTDRPLAEGEYEAFKAQWQRVHGRNPAPTTGAGPVPVCFYPIAEPWDTLARPRLAPAWMYCTDRNTPKET